MVPATGPRYRARSMTPTRSGGGILRRTIPTLFLVTIAAVLAITIGPLLAAPQPIAEVTSTPSGRGAAPSASPLAGSSIAVASPTAAAMGAPSGTPTSTPTSTATGTPTSAPPTPFPRTITPDIVDVRHPVGPSASAVTRAALKKRLDGIRAKYAIPGISVTILFPDGSSWDGSSGYADLERRTPVTPDTAFAIASVTKTFTAALIMALREEGRLGLDVPVSRYLPELRLDRKITVRMLLDHTSGLRDFFFHPRIDPVLVGHPSRAWDEATALRYVGKPYFKPGRGWHYSNTNYLILGLLAAKLGEAPLDELFRTRFSEPLGLSDTYYQPTEAPLGPAARGYRFATTSVKARAVDLSDGSARVPFTSVVTAAAAAGGMAASASDLARWARALYAGSALDPTSVQAMLEDVARTKRFKPSIPYGLGVQAIEVAGRPSLGHSGRLLGFRSVMRWLPEEGIAIAVLTNQSRTDPGIIARALLRIALKPAPQCACDQRR